MRNYSDLVQEASEIESQAQKPSLKYIEIDIEKGEMVVTKAKSYSELMAMLAHGSIFRFESRPQQAEPSRGIMTKRTKAKKEIVSQPEEYHRSAVSDDALREIGELVTSRKLQQVPIEPQFEVGDGKLVLPGLSVSDQIAELEGIIESIKNNYFDSYQMQVAERELKGLQKAVESEKGTSSDSLNKEMVAVRNRRLSEAIGLLHKE